MSYKLELQSNNVDLQSILNRINSLPENVETEPAYSLVEFEYTTSQGGVSELTIPELIGKNFFIISVSNIISNSAAIDDEEIICLLYMCGHFYATSRHMFGKNTIFMNEIQGTFDNTVGQITLGQDIDGKIFPIATYTVRAC